jgi:ribosomal-protein-alanine N-acetyltransferase
MIAPETLALNGEHVRLRRLDPADAAALFGMFSDPEVMRYWSRPPMADPAQAEALLEQVLADYGTGASLPLGIERSRDSILVGNCTLHHFHETSRRAEIGYCLGRAYWGHGYMHEALQALVRYAFGDLDLNRLEADIDPRNLRSARSLERLGFVKEGHLRSRWIVAGEVSDTGFYGLLRDDWQRARQGG